MFERSTGILLPIFHFHQIRYRDSWKKKLINLLILRSAGQKYWQIFYSHTSYGDSPYSCFSVFAGNPYFIDLDVLFEEGFIEETDLKVLTSEAMMSESIIRKYLKLDMEF